MRPPITRTLLVPLALAAALAACGGGGSSTPTSTPGPTTSAASVAIGAAASTTPGIAPAASEWAAAPGARLRAVSNVGSDGTKTVTRLLVASLRGDVTKQVRYVDGAWTLPVPVPGGDTEGLAYDGSLAVLQSTDTPSRFVVLRLASAAKARVVDLQDHGSFGFDALSPDGAALYLTQYRDVTGAAVARIWRYDLRAGALDPSPVVDKAEGGETMAGVPVARTRSADGATVYTVYEGPRHPFLHELLTTAAVSFCIDLPGTPAGAATGTWSARLGTGGTTLTATSDRLGKAFVVRLTDVPALERVAALPTAAQAP